MEKKKWTWEDSKSLLIRFKASIIFGYVIGLLAFTYTFCNKLVQWDEIFCSFSKGASLEAGRWGLDILQYIFPNYSMPWLWGIISLTFIIISACFSIELFEIKQTWHQCLLTGLMVTFPSIISSYSYMFQSVTYTFGILLCVFALFLIVKTKIWGKGIAIACLVFVFSIYQAFISIVASYFVLLVIKELLKEENDGKGEILQALQYVAYLLIAIVAYIVITFVLFKIKEVPLEMILDRTEGEEPMGFLMRFANTYLYFAGYFFHGTAGLIPTLLSVICHVLAMLIVAYCCIKWMTGEKKKSKIAILVIAVIILPIAINAIIFISTSTHTLMVYGFVSIYILAFMMLENTETPDTAVSLIFKMVKKALPITMLLVVVANIYTANLVALRMTYSNTALEAFYTELCTRIKMCEGYEEGDRIAFVGETNELRYNIDNKFRKISIVGTNALDANIYSYEYYIKYYLGNDFDFLSNEEVEEQVKTLPEYQEMAIYPYDGSVMKVGEYIIVNFSND